MADDKNFKIKIICPDRVFYEGEAEMVEFTKNQVLTQAGTAMLAQANSQSQNVLALLQ